MASDACVRAMQVARTSAGVYVTSRLSGQGSESGHGSDLDEVDVDPCLEVEHLLCVTVDACGRPTSGFVSAHFRYWHPDPSAEADPLDDLDREDLTSAQRRERDARAHAILEEVGSARG